MSGYRFHLMVELESNSNCNFRIDEFSAHFEQFVTDQIEADGLKVHRTITNKEERCYEVIFFDDEYAITSFNIFFETINESVKYLNIIDDDNYATKMISSDTFFDNIIQHMLSKYEILCAALLGDIVYENYEVLFSELKSNKRNEDIRSFYIKVK